MSHAVQKSLVLPSRTGNRAAVAQKRSIARAQSKRLSVSCAATVEGKTESKGQRVYLGDKGKKVDEAAAVKQTDVFYDSRWKNGTWDYSLFQGKDGETDWDDVIDAEVRRRRILEDKPEATKNDDMVTFDTSDIPLTAWVKRFHLPQAEQVNGRAAMIGFFAAYMVDLTTGVSIVDATNSFWGHCFMGLTFLGVMLVRRTEDLDNLKELANEATFYDRQWSATWDGVERPSEKQK